MPARAPTQINDVELTTLSWSTVNTAQLHENLAYVRQSNSRELPAPTRCVALKPANNGDKQNPESNPQQSALNQRNRVSINPTVQSTTAVVPTPSATAHNELLHLRHLQAPPRLYTHKQLSFFATSHTCITKHHLTPQLTHLTINASEISFESSPVPENLHITRGGEGTRTLGLYIANVALYQLSYTPEAPT